MTRTCAACGSAMGDDATICANCTQLLEMALAETEAVVRELEINLARQATRVAPMGGARREEPEEPHLLDAPELGVHVQKLPYDAGASTALGALRGILVGWVRLVLDEAPRRRRAPGDTHAEMARYLHQHLEWLRHHPAAADAVTEIADAVRDVRRATDRHVDRWYVGACGAGGCHEPLYCMAGAATMICPACRTEHDVTARRARMLDELEDKLATAEECSWAVSHSRRQVHPATIRKWAERRRIMAHSVNAVGRPLYRIGDILDLLADEATRETG